MKGIIVYKGKYGATKQYAEWLAQQLNLPLATAEDLNQADLAAYDYIVIGCSVYIGKLQISKWLDDNLPSLQHKKIFFFIVAATPPEQKAKLDDYFIKGVPARIRQNCQCFYLPGRMIFSRLSFMDKLLLKMGASMTKDPKAKKHMLTDFDKVDKKQLEPMLASVKSFASQSILV